MLRVMFGYCVGGGRFGSAGRYPGVIEEALLAVRDNKPLYLASFLGGASEQIVEAIEGKQITDDFCRPPSLDQLYSDPPVRETDRATRDDRSIDRVAIWNEFAQAGRESLQQ
jgi:hypothetical protein